MPDTPELLVVGSIALDSRDGPFGKLTDELGGSAVYFALAASLICPVQVVGPVGRDAVDRVKRAFGSRPIDTSMLSVLDAPTYRWSAHQEHGHTIDLGSSDTIYDQWKPEVPAGFRGWAFAGSMRPDRQAEAVRQLHSAQLLSADAMLSYVEKQSAEAKDVLKRTAWFFCNEAEFAALGGEDPEQFRRQWWLEGLVLKRGARGVTAHTADGHVHVPALSTHPAFDTTGAGDAVAGGMLARWLITGAQRSGLRDALVCGVACASLTIESIGIRGMASATPQLLEQRMAEVWESANRES
ncbi:MAG TPA: PfkB family carbohydrate kinase [Candidatus Dormibacteraeota bacterium]|nr:PfkB family carbohydrate kinase [Candidatus Dormibacteraeota bacterium]